MNSNYKDNNTILSITSKDNNKYEDVLLSSSGKPGRATISKMLSTSMKNIDSKEVKIVIVGSGAFGTAVANALSFRENSNVVIYGIDKDEITDIDKNHKNSKYFSTTISSKISATRDKVSAFEGADFIFIGLPTQAVETVFKSTVLPNITQPAYFVNLSKGLDYTTINSISEKLSNIIPSNYNLGIAKLSGPSFATELVQKSPTALVAASRIPEVSMLIEKLFEETPFIHIEKSNDILGVEYSSIFKNSLSILLGMASGLGFKRNTLSIIFVNALKEIRSLGGQMGIEEETILGFAGLGDLFLTGGSLKSRNFTVGYKIGKQNKITKKVLQIFSTIEGLKSVEFLQGIAYQHGITLPLNTILYEIIYLGRQPKEAIDTYLKEFCEFNN